jgi:hypothetical protein
METLRRRICHAECVYAVSALSEVGIVSRPDLDVMTHGVLVGRAVSWLKKTKRCCPVLREFRSAASEIPDAIGWRYHRSIVVECKVSVSDFRAEANKPSARGNRQVGLYKYYMTPRGLLNLARTELPDKCGLLEYDGSVVRIIREAEIRDTSWESEMQILVSVLRRVHARVGNIQDFSTKYSLEELKSMLRMPPWLGRV